MSSPNGSLVIAVKPKANCGFLAVKFYFLYTRGQLTVAYFSQIYYQTFRVRTLNDGSDAPISQIYSHHVGTADCGKLNITME